MLWQLKKAVASVSILGRAFYKGCLFLFSRVFLHFSLDIGGQIASGDLDGHLKMDGKQNLRINHLKKLSGLTHSSSANRQMFFSRLGIGQVQVCLSIPAFI